MYSLLNDGMSILSDDAFNMHCVSLVFDTFDYVEGDFFTGPGENYY